MDGHAGEHAVEGAVAVGDVAIVVEWRWGVVLLLCKLRKLC